MTGGMGFRLAICDSLSLATVGLLNDLGASALESQNRKPDPGFGFRVGTSFKRNSKGYKAALLVVMKRTVGSRRIDER
jgi:hypothetical protein